MTDQLPTSQADATPTDATESIAAQLAVTMATRLGRAGRYQQAEQVLATLPEAQGTSPPVLDLMARLRVQQGDLLGAAALWQGAVKRDPGNPTYRAALSRLEAIQGGAGRRSGTVIGVVVVTLVVLGLIWFRGNLQRLQEADRIPRWSAHPDRAGHRGNPDGQSTTQLTHSRLATDTPVWA